MNVHLGWDKHFTSNKVVVFGIVDVRRISVCCFQIVSITKVHMKTYPLPNSCRILFSRTLLLFITLFLYLKNQTFHSPIYYELNTLFSFYNPSMEHYQYVSERHIIKHRSLAMLINKEYELVCSNQKSRFRLSNPSIIKKATIRTKILC